MSEDAVANELDSATRWLDVAQSLRMKLSHASDQNVSATTFHTLRRELQQGAAWPGAAGTTPWLLGERQGVAVIVRTLRLRQTTEQAKPHSPTHTTAVAEIDPPLFAGLRMFTRDMELYFGKSFADTLTGHPSLDATFCTHSFDGGRVREIFVPRGIPDRLGEATGHASRAYSIVIRDSQVETLVLGAKPDAARVEGLVDLATSIAREVSNRARTLAHTELETKAREAWQRLALRLGLSIDPLRWHIFGQLGDVEVSAMLDGSPPSVFTTFRARLRTKLPTPMFLRRGFRSRVAFVTWEDGKPPGYPELDGLLVLQARDPEQARASLASPELRKCLAAEAETSNLVLDDCEIILGRGGFASTREIAQRLQALVAIVDLLTPPLRTNMGPFR